MGDVGVRSSNQLNLHICRHWLLTAETCVYLRGNALWRLRRKSVPPSRQKTETMGQIRFFVTKAWPARAHHPLRVVRAPSRRNVPRVKRRCEKVAVVRSQHGKRLRYTWPLWEFNGKTRKTKRRHRLQHSSHKAVRAADLWAGVCPSYSARTSLTTNVRPFDAVNSRTCCALSYDNG